MEGQAIRTGTAGNQGQYVSMPTKKSHPDVTLTMPSYTLGKVWEVVTATATGNQKQEVASNGLCLLLLVETEWLPKASWQWVCVIFSASTLYSLVGISFYVKWVKIDEWTYQFRRGQCSRINSLILPYTGRLWGWSWALRRENVAFLCLTLPTWMMWPKFTKTKKISLPVLKHRIVHVLHNPQESCQ